MLQTPVEKTMSHLHAAGGGAREVDATRRRLWAARCEGKNNFVFFLKRHILVIAHADLTSQVSKALCDVPWQ